MIPILSTGSFVEGWPPGLSMWAFSGAFHFFAGFSPLGVERKLVLGWEKGGQGGGFGSMSAETDIQPLWSKLGDRTLAGTVALPSRCREREQSTHCQRR